MIALRVAIKCGWRMVLHHLQRLGQPRNRKLSSNSNNSSPSHSRSKTKPKNDVVAVRRATRQS